MKIIINFFKNNFCSHGVQKSSNEKKENLSQEKGSREKGREKGPEVNVREAGENSGK